MNLTMAFDSLAPIIELRNDGIGQPKKEQKPILKTTERVRSRVGSTVYSHYTHDIVATANVTNLGLIF